MQTSPPVIMQIIPELSAGGAEQGCIDVGAEIARGGARSIIISHGGNRVYELERHGIVHINMPVHSKNPATIWRNISRLRNLIEQYRADIVHVRSRAPAWSAWRACQGTPAHFMSTCHAPYNISGKIKQLYNSAIMKGERVIAISNFIAGYIQENYKVNPNNIRIVPRGIALEKFHPTSVTAERMITLSKQWRIPDGANIVLLPGRLTRWKGHHILIEALSRMRRQDLFCVIIGSDQGRSEYRKELESTVEEKGLAGNIRIVDHCNDMPAAYMLATVVVSASIEPEGFGRVPVEAQAMGRPTIATDHGGAKETVIGGQTGWLIPPSDPRAMEQAINEALSLTPSQRVLLATRAMAHVAENFTRENMTDRTMDVYAELLINKNAFHQHGNSKTGATKAAE